MQYIKTHCIYYSCTIAIQKVRTDITTKTLFTEWYRRVAYNKKLVKIHYSIEQIHYYQICIVKHIWLVMFNIIYYYAYSFGCWFVNTQLCIYHLHYCKSWELHSTPRTVCLGTREEFMWNCAHLSGTFTYHKPKSHGRLKLGKAEESLVLLQALFTEVLLICWLRDSLQLK